MVRYADDSVIGFQHEEEAERFLEAMRERFAKFGLALTDISTATKGARLAIVC